LTIRRLVSGRLAEKHQANWWKEKVPAGVQAEVEKKQKDERDTTRLIC